MLLTAQAQHFALHPCSWQPQQQPFKHVNPSSAAHASIHKHAQAIRTTYCHRTCLKAARRSRQAVLLSAQQPDGSSSNDSHQTEQQAPQPNAPGQQPSPTLLDGVNWYCYTVLGLLFLTDFTPLGQWLLSESAAGSAAGRLALVQWGAFVVPSVVWIRSKGWNLQSTFKLRTPNNATHWFLGLAAGPLLWALINAAIAIKTGNTQTWMTAGADMGSSGSSPGLLLLGGASDGAALQQMPLLLLTAAVSPAVAEELLFRGLLLTALEERLGRIDAVAVCAALFALIHLDPQQFFLYCVLGGACGAAAMASGSVGPAILLHLGFNAAAVAAGVLLHSS